jgi:hypothetical protein
MRTCCSSVAMLKGWLMRPRSLHPVSAVAAVAALVFMLALPATALPVLPEDPFATHPAVAPHAATTTAAAFYDDASDLALSGVADNVRWGDVERRSSDASRPSLAFSGELLAPRALPAARQVNATWGGLQSYRHGTGHMTAIEHINYRHAFDSGFSNVSRFAQGTRAADIRNYVDDALRYGSVRGNGSTVVHDLGRTIGYDQAGNAVTGIQVWIRDGVIRTAYPVAP